MKIKINYLKEETLFYLNLSGKGIKAIPVEIHTPFVEDNCMVLVDRYWDFVFRLTSWMTPFEIFTPFSLLEICNVTPSNIIFDWLVPRNVICQTNYEHALNKLHLKLLHQTIFLTSSLSGSINGLLFDLTNQQARYNCYKSHVHCSCRGVVFHRNSQFRLTLRWINLYPCVIIRFEYRSWNKEDKTLHDY